MELLVNQNRNFRHVLRLAIGFAVAASGCRNSDLGRLASMSTGPAQRDGSAGSAERTDASGRSTCGSTPTRLVDFTNDAIGMAPDIAVNSTGLYYVASGFLTRVSLDGRTSVRLAAIPTGTIETGQAIAATKDNVVLAEPPPQGETGSAVVSVPATGGDGTILSITLGLGAVVADDEYAYFADSVGVNRVPIGGGQVTMLSSTKSSTLGLAGTTLYFGAISSVSVDGGPPTVLATVDSGASYPVTCGREVCFASGGPDTQSLMATSPGGTARVLAPNIVTSLSDLAFDGDTFFLAGATADGPTITRVSRSGQRTDALPEAPSTSVGGVAYDDACFYWSTLSGIFSLARSAADLSEG
jgi:hypothetical protein